MSNQQVTLAGPARPPMDPASGLRRIKLRRLALVQLLRGGDEAVDDDMEEEEGGEERRALRLLLGGRMLRRRKMRRLVLAHLLRERAA